MTTVFVFFMGAFIGMGIMAMLTNSALESREEEIRRLMHEKIELMDKVVHLQSEVKRKWFLKSAITIQVK